MIIYNKLYISLLTDFIGCKIFKKIFMLIVFITNKGIKIQEYIYIYFNYHKVWYTIINGVS